MSLVDSVRDHAVFILAGLAILEGALCAYLVRRTEQFKRRLDIAVRAAEDAARAAALAAPGGIDPEVVIGLLRTGQPTSLDSVYAVMERQAAGQHTEN